MYSRIRRLFGKSWNRVKHSYFEVRTSVSFRHLSGPKKLRLRPQDVVLVCLIKNGAFWLDTFMKHYTELGIRHFVFVDNGSTDHTIKYLKSRDKVTVVQSTRPAKHYESYLRRHAIRKYATGHWCLCVDSDELFDYAHSEKLPLSDFIGYLDHEGYTCVVGQMLDMFPEGPLEDSVDDADFAERFRYYDLSAIHTASYQDCPHAGFDYYARGNTIASPEIKWTFGGIRETHFKINNLALTKHPLMRVSPSMTPSVHPHWSRGVKCADISALIRHFKLAGDFRRRTKSDVANKSWESGEPEKYLLGLEGRSELTLKSDTSRRFSGPAALVAEGFLVTSEKFERWAKDHSLRS